jgi:anti-sigma-K factor RskA
VTSDEARELFSAAYDAQLSAAERRAFDVALELDVELAGQFAAFCATLDAVSGDTPDDTPAPDLLRGVQKRLRNASGGRYYGDRFAERSGVGWREPWIVMLGMAVLIGLVLVLFLWLRDVSSPS